MNVGANPEPNFAARKVVLRTSGGESDLSSSSAGYRPGGGGRVEWVYRLTSQRYNTRE